MKKIKVKKKDIITYSIIIIVLIIIFLAIFLFKGQKLDTNGSLINNLYQYLGSDDLQICNGLQVYRDNKVTYDDLDNNTKMCMAYKHLNNSQINTESYEKIEDEEKNICNIGNNITFATDNYEDDICTVSSLKYDDLNTSYQKLYGHDLPNETEFMINYNTICYNENGTYYCGLPETYTKTFGAEQYTYRVIKSAYKKGDEIIIYDYFLKIVNGECYSSYVDKTTNNNCTNQLPEDPKDYNIDYNFLKKYATLYKHTYKQSGDTYYWVSSNPE